MAICEPQDEFSHAPRLFDGCGAHARRALVSSTRTRLVAGVEPEHRELAGELRELLRSSLGYQS